MISVIDKDMSSNDWIYLIVEVNVFSKLSAPWDFNLIISPSYIILLVSFVLLLGVFSIFVAPKRLKFVKKIYNKLFLIFANNSISMILLCGWTGWYSCVLLLWNLAYEDNFGCMKCETGDSLGISIFLSFPSLIND